MRSADKVREVLLCVTECFDAIYRQAVVELVPVHAIYCQCMQYIENKQGVQDLFMESKTSDAICRQGMEEIFVMNFKIMRSAYSVWKILF